MSKGQIYITMTIIVLLTFAYLYSLSMEEDIFREKRWPLEENKFLCNATEMKRVNSTQASDFQKYIENWIKELGS